jgi:homoserine kinase
VSRGETDRFVRGEVRVRVPATCANLGPGFDALGLALDLTDEVTAEVLPEEAGLQILVAGEGAEDTGLPRDARHLVHRALVAGLGALGAPTPPLRLRCHNAIPHSRGLGSSAAAIVAGLALARALVVDAVWSDEHLLSLAAEIEGHPDNVAPAVLGGFTVAFKRNPDGAATSGASPRSQAIRLPVHPDLVLRVLVPPTPVSTELARGLLPVQVPHADAAHNAGRAALLVAALTQRPDLLLEATEDRLHQTYRAPALGEAADVVARLRATGLAAVVSGAGPTVLVLARRDETDHLDAAVAAVVPSRWRVLSPSVGEGVRQVG